MFLMNKTDKHTVSTDGRNSCYHVMGEDEKCYGTFMKAAEAKHLKEKLEERTDGSFRIATYSIGPSVFFKHLMDDYEESKQ